GGTTDPATRLNYNGSGGTDPGPANIDFTPYPVGTDIWTPGNQDPVNGCAATSATNDLSHACSSSTGNVPWDSGDLGTVAYDTAPSNRFDYLFVVSPPSVNRQDMVITATSSIHSIYTPMRFMSPNDCKSQDPDQPSFPGDCSPSRMLTYGITVADPGT